MVDGQVSRKLTVSQTLRLQSSPNTVFLLLDLCDGAKRGYR